MCSRELDMALTAMHLSFVLGLEHFMRCVIHCVVIEYAQQSSFADPSVVMRA